MIGRRRSRWARPSLRLRAPRWRGLRFRLPRWRGLRLRPLRWRGFTIRLPRWRGFRIHLPRGRSFRIHLPRGPGSGRRPAAERARRFRRRHGDHGDALDVAWPVRVLGAHEDSGEPRTILEVAGEQVHLVETGRLGGRPPVLLSSGLGGAWFDWQPTADLLNERFRVICFDRPGVGLSPARHAAPSLRAEVRLLAGLAEWAEAPIVLVAHSMAAFHAEAFARIHPDLVCGLVLVDPSSERETRSGMRVSAAVIPLTRVVGLLFKVTGLALLIGPLVRKLVMPVVSRRGDTASASTVRSVYGRGDVLAAVIAENSAYREMAADLAQLRKRRPFPPIPLVVLTALGDTRSSKRRRRWSRRHRDLARMSPLGHQVILPDSLHMLPLDEPKVIADAVAEVTAVRRRDASTEAG